MKDDKCMGPIGNLGARPIEAKPIPASKRESSATDRYLDNASSKHMKEGSKVADEKARNSINRMAKRSK